MNNLAGKLLGWLSLVAIFSGNTLANTSYVNVSNPVPAAPFASWESAATNIQDAIDVSSDGDLILVTNGVYATGGRVVDGSQTNRVAITKAVTVQSVNGPEVTTIKGYQMPGTTNGTAAIRCVYLAANAVLSGFTLTNGATTSGGNGGGAFCAATNAMITNCLITANAALQKGGGVFGGSLQNCQLSRNRAASGGGCSGSRLNACTLAGNTIVFLGQEGGGAESSWLTNCWLLTNSAAVGGGGAVASKLYGCTLIGNFASDSSGFGGGADSCLLVNCVLIGNHAYRGGGVSSSFLGNGLTNCILMGNYAERGGGISGSTAHNCIFYTNTASYYGGAAYQGNLYNCVLVKNSAGTSGGGAYMISGNEINNSILYYNTAGTYSNYYSGTLKFCCTRPLGTAACITNEPAFVDLENWDFHLQSNSPCIDAGYNGAVFTTTDLDGGRRISGGTVDIGAYEFTTPVPVWAQRYALPDNADLKNMDTDADGLSDYAEWVTGTNPTNAASVLNLAAPILASNPAGITVIWQSKLNVVYFLQRSSDLSGDFTTLKSSLFGLNNITTSYTDASATNSGPYFYRVGVQ